MSYSTLSQFTKICSKKIFRWHKDILSWFTDIDEQESLHEFDMVDKDKVVRSINNWSNQSNQNAKTNQEIWTNKSKFKTIWVPILNPDNFTENMAIDDKNIWWLWYTIISSKDTWRIALLISTTKSDIIFDTLKKVPIEIRMKVKTISRDLAKNYEAVSRYAFMNADQIWDKFHVVKLAIEALQDVRVRYRQEILTEERLLKKSSKEYIEKFKVKFSNWETIKQVLANSRHQLSQFEYKRNDEQKERAEILFKKFPEIKKAYDLICWFRAFYNIKHSKKWAVTRAKKSLSNWYEKVKEANISEIENFMYTVQYNSSCILNYFESWHTNANAESLNSRIQRFMWLNYWIRNRDFFHFRLKQYFL